MVGKEMIGMRKDTMKDTMGPLLGLEKREDILMETEEGDKKIGISI
jgi:hypothetical protein